MLAADESCENEGDPLKMTDSSDSACVLLGMDDLDVKAVTEEEGELLVLVRPRHVLWVVPPTG
jgi:hypothetical protein